jgi:hypothetical protein
VAAAWLVVSCSLAAAEPPGAPAELPRERLNFQPTPAGRVIRVTAGGDVQSALDEARPGDTIELEVGGEFQGPIVLPRKTADEPTDLAGEGHRWITIRPAPASHPLPAAGTRVTPADAPALARLVASRGAVLIAAPGASHYRLIGLELRPGRKWLRPEAGAFLNSVVWLGSDSRAPDATPHHIVFERCYFSGDPRVGTRRGLVLNSAHTAVLDSYFADFKMQGEDAQAIVGWAGPGPFLIRNNYLEGSGENLMFGGADPLIPDLVPADIEILGNHFAKPTAWREGEADFEGVRWSVKNLLQLKNAKRVLIEGNLFEHSWAESQTGFAVQFTVRNQEGTAPWSVVEDVTFRNNVVRQVGRGFNIAGFDDAYPSQQTSRITIDNNLFENVGGRWGLGDLFQVLDGVTDVTIVNNTGLHSGKILIGEGRPVQGFGFLNNIVFHNEYGIKGTDAPSGVGTLDRYFPGAVVLGNRFVGGEGYSYPAGNDFPGDLDAAIRGAQAGERRDSLDTEPGVGVDLARLCDALSPTERAVICAAPRDGGVP